jgi:hypothetical protein
LVSLSLLGGGVGGEGKKLHHAAHAPHAHIDVQKSFFLNIKIEEIKGKE